jgi:MerR family transcriptional regulator, light-induced transcriptional regulator
LTTPTLTRMVKVGDLDGAYAFCLRQSAIIDRGIGAVFTHLLLPVVHALEAEWVDDNADFAVITQGFWNLKRLIERLSSSDSLTLSTAPYAGRCLIALAEHEEHSFGAQIVSEELRFNGWDVDLLLNAKRAEVLQRLASKHYDMLGLTVGHDAALSGLADMIGDARMQSYNPAIKVIVGGNIFDAPLSQYRFVGADHIARNAGDAMVYFRSVRPTTSEQLRN